MYNHNKAQQSKNRVHISWDILYSAYIVESMRAYDIATQEARASSVMVIIYLSQNV